jgi:hypothetical protein
LMKRLLDVTSAMAISPPGMPISGPLLRCGALIYDRYAD